MHQMYYMLIPHLYLLFDLDTGRGTCAVSSHADRETSFTIGGRRHGHQSHCVREQVRWRVDQTALLQHRCQDHLLVAFTTA